MLWHLTTGRRATIFCDSPHRHTKPIPQPNPLHNNEKNKHKNKCQNPNLKKKEKSLNMDQNNAAEGPSLLSCAGALTDSVPNVLSLRSIKKTLPCFICQLRKCKLAYLLHAIRKIIQISFHIKTNSLISHTSGDWNAHGQVLHPVTFLLFDSVKAAHGKEMWGREDQSPEQGNKKTHSWKNTSAFSKTLYTGLGYHSWVWVLKYFPRT